MPKEHSLTNVEREQLREQSWHPAVQRILRLYDQQAAELVELTRLLEGETQPGDDRDSDRPPPTPESGGNWGSELGSELGAEDERHRVGLGE